MNRRFLAKVLVGIVLAQSLSVPASAKQFWNLPANQWSDLKDLEMCRGILQTDVPTVETFFVKNGEFALIVYDGKPGTGIRPTTEYLGPGIYTRQFQGVICVGPATWVDKFFKITYPIRAQAGEAIPAQQRRVVAESQCVSGDVGVAGSSREAPYKIYDGKIPGANDEKVGRIVCLDQISDVEAPWGASVFTESKEAVTKVAAEMRKSGCEKGCSQVFLIRWPSLSYREL